MEGEEEILNEELAKKKKTSEASGSVNESKEKQDILMMAQESEQSEQLYPSQFPLACSTPSKSNKIKSKDTTPEKEEIVQVINKPKNNANLEFLQALAGLSTQDSCDSN